ncbi:MAG: hypothetical protein ACP5GZ_03405 [Vulcanisaeta sp.]|uniref:hypothetical protein n=1 Tax=Vulcanisaeta sp. TaxID=2020871 RepID=UPI003D12A217
MLVNVKNEILNNWDKIRSEGNVSAKDSALGTKMHYLSGFSLHPFVTLDVKVNNAEQILAGLFISDVSPVEYNNGMRAVTLNSPDPHLAATLLISLISYLNVDKVKDYIYGCSGGFFGGSSGRGSEHYVVCPVKASVINDIVNLASGWPSYGLTDRVVKLLEAARYSTPCLTYAKYPRG